MFPLKDDNPTESFPVVTLLIIAACFAVWILVQGAGFDEPTLEGSVCALGAIPAELTGRGGEGPCVLGGLTWEAVLSSMFLHASWMHVIGNMWFFWIFGNNVEDSMGHVRFVVFYLITGVAAAAAHVLSDPSSTAPIVGASGAISGIMGAYLMLYPRARVKLLVVLIFFITTVWVPAWLMLGYWFLEQTLAQTTATASEGGGGVAFMAHVGGFVAGAILIKLFARPERVGARRAARQWSDPYRGGGWT